MSWRTLRVVCFGVVSAAAAAQACGGNSSDPSSSNAGSAGDSGEAGAPDSETGSAGRAQASKLECGDKTCSGVLIPVSGMSYELAPCCADEATSQCGIDSTLLASFGPSFPEACQPVAQPGVKDKACPDSPKQAIEGSPITISFAGCCRPNNTCGYQLDDLGGFIPLGLGCVDSAPFVDGGVPQSCGDATGEGGAGGAGGTDAAGSSGEPASGAGGA